jgi:hypothetical protein
MLLMQYAGLAAAQKIYYTNSAFKHTNSNMKHKTAGLQNVIAGKRRTI